MQYTDIEGVEDRKIPIFMAARCDMSMKIYVQQIRRFISIDGYCTHFFNIPFHI